jgi:hypothetical protein
MPRRVFSLVTRSANGIFVLLCLLIRALAHVQAATEGYSTEQMKKSKIVKMMLQGL